MFSAIQVQSRLARKRGARGFVSGFEPPPPGAFDRFSGLSGSQAWGFRGFGDIPYTVDLGGGLTTTINLPDGWVSMGIEEKRMWITQSNLAPDVASALEQEAGLDVPTILPAPTGVVPYLGPTVPAQTADYVHAGDVVQVTMPISWGNVTPVSNSAILSAIASGIRNGNLSYVSGNVGGIFTSSITVNVQALGDFAHLQDVASIVQAAAQSTGIAISGPATASFVSKAAQTGGARIAPAPTTTTSILPSLGLGSTVSASTALGLSTGTLILGAGAVLLILVMAKK